MVFAYVRVSKQEQNLDRQLESVKAFKPVQIFKEKGSGSKKDRPGLLSLLSLLREGDTIVVDSISRIGRSTSDLLWIYDQIESKGATLISIKENWDFSTASGKLIRSIFSVLSEFERTQLIERTNSGLEAARRKGKLLGRPSGLTPENVKKAALAYSMYHSENYSINEILELLQIAKPTLYKYVKFHESSLKKK